VSATQSTKNHEEASNFYSLPSIQQSIKYLHAAAGFPVKETWIDAIKYGNFVTWPGLTTTTVRKHFPDSDKTQQGHMRKQRRGVRSMRTKIDTNEEGTHQNKMPAKKCKMCISKSTTPVKQCIPINQDASQQRQAKKTNTSLC
jgi:hypothetical protein